MESVRSKDRAMKYALKDGNYISNFSEEELDKARSKMIKASELHQNARKLAREGNLEEAQKVLEDPKTARDMNLYGPRILANLRDLAPVESVNFYTIDQYDFQVSIWDRMKTLILWGPTNTGKTSLAKAILPKALICSHIDDLKKYATRNYHGIIFDDMDFKHWPDTAQIHLTDVENPRSINVKHGTASIPAGTPRIITNNKTPQEVLKLPAFDWDKDPIGRRCQHFWVEKSLIKTPVPRRTTVSTTTTTTTTSSQDSYDYERHNSPSFRNYEDSPPFRFESRLHEFRDNDD